ncbi:MAG: hypothetical protein JXJ20_06550 [Anaerolineae bacterium]|nr:hypothetical protein [Anaerolineae bacterium]
MIPKKQLLILFVCLTLCGLAACEPLAPEQTPQVIVVTGETPVSAGPPTATAPLGGTVPVAEGTTPVEGPTGVSGVVNTPIPSPSPTPVATAVPTATPFVCNETAGQVLELSLSSAVVGRDVPFRMYLPPCFYSTFRRYPYVILLHGTSYDEAMWQDLGAVDIMDEGVTSSALPPMVLVMPDGGLLSETNDQPDGQSYEAIILDELIPRIEADFCLWGNREGRAIGGISRGGFWAFSIALRHPELFSAVGGHSPHFELDNASPDTNPMDLVGRVSLTKFPLRIYMDNGANDYVGENALRLSEILRENGIQHQYLINPTGDHTEDYWAAHIAEYLSFYGQPWPQDVEALPSCLEPSPE